MDANQFNAQHNPPRYMMPLNHRPSRASEDYNPDFREASFKQTDFRKPTYSVGKQKRQSQTYKLTDKFYNPKYDHIDKHNPGVTLEKQLPPVAEHPKVVNDKWYDAKHDITWARQPTASLSLTASRPAPFPFHVPEDNMYKPKHDVVEKKLGKRISLGKQAGRDLTTDTKPLNDKFYSTDNQHKHHLNSTSFVTHSNPRQLTAGNLANDLDFVISHADRQCAQIDRLLAQYSDTFQTTGFSTP